MRPSKRISNSLGSAQDSNEVSQPATPSNRILEPKYLCFLTGKKHPKMQEELGQPRLVSDWKRDHPEYHGKCPDYVFVAYTAEQFNHSSGPETRALHLIAARATKEAGLFAYWVGVSCMERGDLEGDVYRISDIVRGAHSLVIAVGARDIEGQPRASTHCVAHSSCFNAGGRVFGYCPSYYSANHIYQFLCIVEGVKERSSFCLSFS
jgi:hypothetical protein